MRKEKTLAALLRAVADLIRDEAARNPEFAARVDAVLSEFTAPPATAPRKKDSPKQPVGDLPDVHAEWTARGETEFRHWVRDQPVSVLRELIRSLDVDPTRRTAKWNDPEKLSEFLSDNLRARLARGSAFIGRRDRLQDG